MSSTVSQAPRHKQGRSWTRPGKVRWPLLCLRMRAELLDLDLQVVNAIALVHRDHRCSNSVLGIAPVLIVANTVLALRHTSHAKGRQFHL